MEQNHTHNSFILNSIATWTRSECITTNQTGKPVLQSRHPNLQVRYSQIQWMGVQKVLHMQVRYLQTQWMGFHGNYLNRPHGLTQVPNSSRWIEYNLSTIHSKCLPVQWVMSPIAYVNCYFSKRCLKYRVSCVAFHIVGALIEISHSWYVILWIYYLYQ